MSFRNVAFDESNAAHSYGARRIESKAWFSIPRGLCAGFRLLIMVFVLCFVQAWLPAQDRPTPPSLELPQIDPALAAEHFDPATISGTVGYFRVGRSTTGHWWFQDPEGRPFFFRGVTSVSREQDLEPPEPYTHVVLEKYGRDAAGFRKATFERLRNWGFNALGAWSNRELWDQGMPYTVILDFSKTGPRIEGTFLPDVFDPAWIETMDKIAGELVEPRRNSKQLIGYFTDNELGWAQALADERQLEEEPLDPEQSPSLLQLCLSQNAGRPAYEAAWQFALNHHGGSLSQLASAWRVPLHNKSDVELWTRNKTALRSQAYLNDDATFSREFARRYFQLTAQAIKKYDPNHLLLGCRFGAPPGEAILSQVKRPWVDVISANNYRFEMQARMNIYYRATGLPVLNTEFSWGHAVFSERPLPNQQPWGVTDVERMARNGQVALEDSFRLPGLVGWTWYRWVDKPEMVPPVTFGLVNIHDEQNAATTDLVTRINACAERIAITGWCGVAPYDLGVDPLDDRASEGADAAQGGPPSLPTARPVPDGFAERRKLLLQALANEDATYFEKIKPVPDPNKFAIPTVLAKLEEGTDRDGAFAYLGRHTDEMYHFGVVGLARLLPTFGDQLPSDTRKRMESAISANSNWTADGTENHKLMWLTSGVVLSSQLPQLSFYGGASEWRRKQLLEPIRLYVKRLYEAGQGEWDSSTYETFSVQGFLNLYDFSTDPYAKAVAAAALDWYSTAMALKYFAGTLAGPERRGFDDGTLKSDTGLSAWLWWGDSSRAAANGDFTGPQALAGRYSVYAALSGYRPHPALAELAHKLYPVEGSETKPDYRMEHSAESYGTFYGTSNYFLGSAEVGTSGVSPSQAQMSPWKLVAKGPGTNYVFTSMNPFYSSDEGRSPYDQLAQHESALIQMTFIPQDAEGSVGRLQEEISNRPSGDDRFQGRVIREARFRFPAILSAEEDKGWFFIAADRTWIAVRPLQSGATVEREAAGSADQYIVDRGSIAGFVVQVADRGNYETLQAFHDDVLGKVSLDFSGIAKGHIEATMLDGARLDFTYNPGGAWPAFKVDGVVKPSSLTKVYDTPAVQQQGGRLTVRDRSGAGFQWDFTGEWPYYTELRGANAVAN